MSTQIKVALVGDSAIGKSTLLTRHINGNFIETYKPTVEPIARQLTFNTSHGHFEFLITEINQLYQLQEVEVDAYIIMFDGLRGFEPILKWYQAIVTDHRYNGEPIALLASKCDLLSHFRSVAPIMRDLRTCKSIGIWECSSLSNYNFERPFWALIEHKVGSKVVLKGY